MAEGDSPILRVGVVSDTHGYLSTSLLDELSGSDVIVHAGDICSRSHYERLWQIAPVHLCLGNNDWGYQYGPEVKNLLQVTIGGVRWQVCHYREKLDPVTCKVAVCGHTHRPFIETTAWGTIVMNPGSPTFPRTQMGPTCARVLIQDKKVVSAEIVQLSE